MNKKLCNFKHLLLLLLLLLLPSLVFAQEITVKGTVKDTKGIGLPGVTIFVLGNNKGTVTNPDGGYSIKVSPKATLSYSYLGYISAKIAVNNKTSINVTLLEDTKKLDELVVVGYGTMKRSDVTGSVGSISSEALEKSVSTTMDQALQGRIAGVQMTQNSGIPGGGTSMLIRGIGSINSTNEPIYVVDGVIISGETGSSTSNAIAGINPADIESIEVLKDASATAIYGAQGANGVVLISMKKGKDNMVKPSISFNAYYGNQQLNKEIDMMDLRQYATHYNEMQNVFGYPTNRKDAFSNPETLGGGTNWQSAIFRNAPMQNYNLSIRGGDKNTTYSISGGYFSQDGITVSSGFDRSTFRVNVDTKATNWMRIGAVMNGSYTKQNSGIASWSIIPYALYQAPYIPVLNADGTYGGPDSSFDANVSGFSNPFAVAKMTKRENEKLNTRGNVFMTITPNKWFNYRTEFSGDYTIDNYLYYLPAFSVGSYLNAITTNQHSKLYSLTWNWKNMLNFDRTFAKKHKLSGMLAHEVNSFNSDYLYGQRLYGASDLTGLDAGDANYSTNSGYGRDKKFLSVFGRLFYSYKDRYQFTGTVRHDGSSNFAEGHQWGTFPSAAVAWRVSEEEFFKPLEKVINNFKFRLSYGVVGNANVGNFAYQSLLQNVQSNWGSSFKTANVPNVNLTWETTKSWNVGTDLNMFNNRIELIFDAYNKRTSNLLLQAELPRYVGASTDGSTGSADSPWYNIGVMENKGFEFALNTVNISKRNFTWKSGLTFSLNRNKVLEMNSDNATIDKTYQVASNTTSTVTRTTVGKPISQFYGYDVVGRINSASDFLEDNGDGTSTVKVATVKYKKGTVANNSAFSSGSTYIGDILYKDVNGDGAINASDMTYIGNPLPKFTYGITNSFTYKDFDFSVFLYGSYGNKILNILRIRTDDPRQSGNLSARAANYCKIGYLDGNSSNTNIWNVYVLPGSDPTMVRMGATDPNGNSAVSSRFVEDGSYLRIQNVSIGYTFPKKLLTSIGISKLRVYSNIQNLFTFTKYSGFDPEVGATQGQYSYSGQSMLMYGVDAGRVPSPRVYTVGIDLTF